MRFLDRDERTAILEKAGCEYVGMADVPDVEIWSLDRRAFYVPLIKRRGKLVIADYRLEHIIDGLDSAR